MRRYNERDRVHWPGFDYVETDAHAIDTALQLFKPDSDFDYKCVACVNASERRRSSQ